GNDGSSALMAAIGVGALAVSPSGEVFFADELDNVIRKLTPAPSGSAVLSASPAGLYFRVSSAPSSAPLTVGVNGTAAGWTATTNVNWLTLSPPSGGLFVTASPAGLAAGTYNGAITIQSSQAVNHTVTIPVTMTVLPVTPSLPFLPL